MARVTTGGTIGDFLRRTGADLPQLALSLEQIRTQRGAREDRIARQGVLDERFDLQQQQRREDMLRQFDQAIRQKGETAEQRRIDKRTSDERFERQIAVQEGNLAERERANRARENKPTTGKTPERENLVAKARKDLAAEQAEQAKRRNAFNKAKPALMTDPVTGGLVGNTAQFGEQPITIKDIFQRDLQHFLPGDPKFGQRGTDSIAGVLGIDDAADQFGRQKYPDWDDLEPEDKKRIAQAGFPDK